MRYWVTLMLVMMAMPMVASGMVLLDEDFDGVPAGTSLDDLGFEPSGFVTSRTTIDQGNSVDGDGGEVVYNFNHTLSGSNQFYRIDVTVFGPSGQGPPYFWARNSTGVENIFFNHYVSWGDVIELQSQHPTLQNAQEICCTGGGQPRTTRLEIYQDDATLFFDPDGSGGFLNQISLSDTPGNAFGFTDLANIRMNGANGASYDSILVQVIPEPASMGLIAMGTLAMLRRRRKV